MATGTKPSFLLWDKVYQKLTDIEDQTWLLRASEAALRYYGPQLNTNQSAWSVAHVQYIPRAYIHFPSTSGLLGQGLLYLALEGQTPEFRRNVVSTLSGLTPSYPELVTEVVSTSLDAYLRRDKPSQKTTSSEGDGVAVVKNEESKLSSFLLTCAAFSDGTENAIREHSLIHLVVLGHHPTVCKFVVCRQWHLY